MNKSVHFSLYLFFFLSSVSFSAYSKMYKCIDENGGVIYSQTACQTDQTTEKVMSSNKPQQKNLEDCQYAGQFASMVTRQMRSGVEAEQSFDRYGGINALSKSTIAVINYVYTFKNTPDTSANRISSLVAARCNARAFGDVKCEDFPEEFQTSIISCDESKREDVLIQQQLMRKNSRPAGSPEQPVQAPKKSQNKSTTSNNTKNTKKRIDDCKERYDKQITTIDDRLRESYSSEEGESLRKRRRQLQNDRYSKCR